MPARYFEQLLTPVSQSAPQTLGIVQRALAYRLRVGVMRMVVRFLSRLPVRRTCDDPRVATA